ncbi:IclR family transcriptional regulator C-terminal domain-containing protein [uncultured Alsobacter sp.]|uniref:IclR family transcriptional regulator domain-containing protein n=1 Tax=uncultured Alsobacter sp. TaxID=1748258 RepID=UPI0025F0EAFF|nr:IclR family transcriptional regulator C-terminal domain-containing protein [uncultured Alsobacter sp.]
MGWDAKQQSAVAGTALIGKALRLVDAIGAAPGAVEVRELMAETGWSRPTLYRILSALVAEGYVRRDPALQGYTLGYRFLELAQNAWAGSDLVAVASLDLQRLRNLTGETAYLAIPHREGVLSIGKFESPHAVRSAARLGVLKPYHCTSQGKAMLAHWDEAERGRRLGPEPFARYTEATFTRREQVEAQLNAVRKDGFAIEDEEILAGSRCVGAPVLGDHGRPVGAISVAGPAWRLTRERAEQLGPEVAEVARRIAQMLQAVERPRQSGGGVAAMAAQAEPAFHGADPQWDAERSALVWTDRLGQAMHATSAGRDDIRRLAPSSPVVASVHAGWRSLVFMGAEAWSVAAGEPVRLPGDTLAGVTAACAGAEGAVWLALPEDGGTVIGLLKGTQVESRWTVRGRIDALACAPDGTLAAAADGARGIVYTIGAGRSAPRVFSRIPPASGRPSALAVDTSDHVWVALDQGWAVARLDDSGEFSRTIPLPVPRPTGLAFGGPEGQSLFVTTARYGLSRDVLERAPMSGMVLELSPGGL